ncbi:MAG: hypothetical protein NC181_02620 [Clostridium sp.]|nr:hypothetical protein [Clostridium sp.]MCM1444145.1 hypothetical protein [Candidatus Amulumruptor caecigallinarius]
MINKVIFKSGIDLNDIKNRANIYTYFIEMNEKGLLENIKFTKMQVEKQISENNGFITNPIIFNMANTTFKDIVFLYDSNNKIIGHMYSSISAPFEKPFNYSIKTYDSYFPEDINDDLITNYIRERLENNLSLECELSKNEQKVKKMD